MQREATQANGHNGGVPAEVVEVSAEELLEEVDRGAINRLGLSGWREFAEKYHSGLLPDTLAVNELGILLESAEEPGF